MAHAFTIREIARQSGLSHATVDRVLNDRGGVRAGTAAEVRRALEELQRQRDQVRVGGRTFFVDLVMQAPARFTSAVGAALEAELPSLAPAVVRSRFHLRESGSPAGLAAVLDGIAARATHGVLLKAPDVPEVAAAARRLVERGIPLVTLVTDVPASGRAAYVGIDNRAAGATAAYLVGQWLGDRPGSVLLTLSSGSFRGEEEREMGFRGAMRTSHPARRLVEVAESQGLDAEVGALVGRELDRTPDVVAVYSIGGGNRATLSAFAERGLPPPVVIAHDLDGDNRELLAAGRLAAVLHHDLRADMRTACQVVLRAQGALPGEARAEASAVQVVTPYNVPPGMPGQPALR